MIFMKKVYNFIAYEIILKEELISLFHRSQEKG